MQLGLIHEVKFYLGSQRDVLVAEKEPHADYRRLIVCYHPYLDVIVLIKYSFICLEAFSEKVNELALKLS
jgi:hypothetical protein